MIGRGFCFLLLIKLHPKLYVKLYMAYIKRSPFGYENTAIFIAFMAIIVQYIGKYTKYSNFSVAW